MKKIFVLFLSICIFSTSNAKDVSEFFSNIIPGDGLTEASIQINEDDDPDPDSPSSASNYEQVDKRKVS